MKKIFFVAALLCASMMSFAIDWSSVEWLGDGAGGGAYNNKYKAVVSPEMPSPGFINNLQMKNEKACIHICFPSAAFGASSLDATQYEEEGAGRFIHLDVFTAQETSFTMECDAVTYTFTVYYADGTATAIDQVQSDKVQSTKVIENGQLVIIKNGIRYSVTGAEMK